jgi:poly(A) polymerase
MLDNYEVCRDQLQHLALEDLHPPRLLTGDDLITLGFTPGKIIGEILQVLEDEQLEGRITTPEEAKDYVFANWKIKL